MENKSGYSARRFVYALLQMVLIVAVVLFVGLLVDKYNAVVPCSLLLVGVVVIGGGAMALMIASGE